MAWSEGGERHIRAGFTAHGEPADVTLVVADDRLRSVSMPRLRSVSMPRCGNPGNGAFHYATCGGLVEAEGTFDGYTIPTRMRIGWHFGTNRFEADGEFFRVTIDDAVFR